MRWYERVVNEEKGINKALPTAQSRSIGLDVCVVAAVLDMVEEVGHHLTFASEKGCIEPKVSSAGGKDSKATCPWLSTGRSSRYLLFHGSLKLLSEVLRYRLDQDLNLRLPFGALGPQAQASGSLCLRCHSHTRYNP